VVKVIAFICPNCEDKIYSRAHHDFRWCSCKEISVDGGLYYNKISFEKKLPESIELEIDVTKKELYDDWNHQYNKFGIIKD